MPYYPETLSRVMNFYAKRKEIMPFILVKLYMFQLLRSIAYLHYFLIGHRDLKPQNLLIDPDTQKLVLCDFGSAKYLDNP